MHTHSSLDWQMFPRDYVNPDMEKYDVERFRL